MASFGNRVSSKGKTLGTVLFLITSPTEWYKLHSHSARKLGLGDTEKRAPRYIVKVIITIIDIITILHVNHKNMLY